MQDVDRESQRKLTFFATLKEVLWSFVGLRKQSTYERDVAKLNPIYVVVAAVLGVIIFITTLILIVKSVVAN